MFSLQKLLDVIIQFCAVVCVLRYSENNFLRVCKRPADELPYGPESNETPGRLAQEVFIEQNIGPVGPKVGLDS